MIFSSLVGVRLEGIRTWSATQLDPASEACDVIDETVFLVVFAAGASFEVLVLCLLLVGCAVKCVVRIWALSSLRNQGKIDDFHIFINISAGIYSSVLRNIPFEREINWLFKKHTLFSIHSTVFLKKFKSEKIYIVDAKKTKMDAIWSKIKCLCRVCLKMNLLLYL